MKQRFKFLLRINYIIYKYEFIYQDQYKDIMLKTIFDNLVNRWIISITYVYTIYVIYFKIIFRLFYFILFYFIYFILFYFVNILLCNF